MEKIIPLPSPIPLRENPTFLSLSPMPSGRCGLRPRPQGRYDAGMKGFLIRCAITGFAVLLASQVIPGLEITSLASGIAAVVILSFLNAILRPVLYLLSAPFILVTFGLFMVLINGFLLYLVSVLVKGFIVSGFWPAVGGAVIISFVSAVLNLWISEQGRIEIVTHSSSGRKIRHIN